MRAIYQIDYDGDDFPEEFPNHFNSLFLIEAEYVKDPLLRWFEKNSPKV